MSARPRLKRCPDCKNAAGYTIIEVGPYAVWVVCHVCHRAGPEIHVCNPIELPEAKRQALIEWNALERKPR